MAHPALQHPDASLDHIYFFVDEVTSHDGAVSSAPTSNQCATPRSEVASLGSSDSEATTITSSSGSSSTSSSHAKTLNPLASNFTPTASTPPIATNLYELRMTADKDYGLFATSFIPIGTRIICDKPLVRIPENSVHLAWGSYCRLSNAQKAAFDKLHIFKPEHTDFEQVSRCYLIDRDDDSLDDDDIEELVAEQVRVMRTFAANNFATGQGLSVFETISRLNHSCVNNVHHSYNPNLQKQTVHAVRDIQPGEELCTTYLGGHGSYYLRPQRIEMLRHSYGFTCNCVACGDTSGQSDGRRELMANLAWGLQQYLEGSGHGQPFVPAAPLAALQHAENLIHWLLAEGLFTAELMKAYRTASTQALSLRDFEKAIDYAYNELEVERNCLGTELEDLKKLGAAAANWIDRVNAVAAAAGVTLSKRGRKNKNKKKQAMAAEKEQKKMRGKETESESKRQARQVRNARKREEKREKKEAELAAREAERKKTEYEAAFPTLSA